MKYLPLSMRFLMSLALLAGIFLQGCVEDRCDQTITYRQYTPVYMDPVDFVNAVAVEAPREISEPGKMFVQDDFLFVNELAEGVHIFDNSNPASPTALAFINVPGNYEIQVSCDKLYLDSSTDLLVFDISNPATPKLMSRSTNALPHTTSFRGFTADASQGLVISWKEEVVTKEFDCQAGVPAYVLMNELTADEMNNMPQNTDGNARTINPGTAGKAGSMSRFTVLEDHLYVVEPMDLRIFDLNNCTVPSEVNLLNLSSMGWGMGEAEMITTLNGHLLVGATGGMYILDASTPATPNMLGTFNHAQACDPVAAEGEIAYVTLRTGAETNCGPNVTNQLDIVSLESMQNPWLITSYNMVNPHGVGVDNGTLFVADGDAGLKIYDASEAFGITDRQLAHFPNMFAYDVIPYDGTLIMIGQDGIAQYDYTDPSNIQLLSTIQVER